MNTILKKTKDIIFQRQKDILSSVIILSTMMIASRFLGLVRNRTFATYFSKDELDLLLASYRIPDFVFEILITGALSSAFIPLFIKYKKSSQELSENVSTIINVISILLGTFMLVAFLGAGVIIPIITPGFTVAQNQEVINISRIYIISQLPFFVYGNVLSGIAQAHKIFILTALAPLMYTIGVILGTIFLSHSLWLYGPAVGTVIGAFLFFFVQIPVLYKTPFHFRLGSWKPHVIKEFFTLFLPRTFSVLTSQIEQTIDLSLATLIGSGSVTIVNFAQRLQLFPVAFVGMAFGQASLPYISSLYKDRKYSAIRNLFIESLLQILYISIPLAFFCIFARTPLVRIAYGGRKFDWEATVLTATTLSYFALSVPFHSMFYFVTRAFYASHDTKTPLYINLFSICLNIILSITFIRVLMLPVWSLGLSFSIAITINVIIHLIAFYRKIEGYDVQKLIFHTAKILLIGFLSSVPAYIILKLLDQLIIDTTRTVNVLMLLGISSFVMGISYLFFSWLFKVEEIYILSRVALRIRSFGREVSEPVTESS